MKTTFCPFYLFSSGAEFAVHTGPHPNVEDALCPVHTLLLRQNVQLRLRIGGCENKFTQENSVYFLQQSIPGVPCAPPIGTSFYRWPCCVIHWFSIKEYEHMYLHSFSGKIWRNSSLLSSLLWYGSICSQARSYCWANGHACSMFFLQWCIVVLSLSMIVYLSSDKSDISSIWIWCWGVLENVLKSGYLFLLDIFYSNAPLWRVSSYGVPLLYVHILHLFPSVQISTLTSGLANLRNLFIQYLARYSHFSPKMLILWFLF